ncbi:hypothetical protein MTO96_035548 [Rhipicephalus appendiculatus]
MSLGVHYTMKKMEEVLQMAQQERLTKTGAVSLILKAIGAVPNRSRNPQDAKVELSVVLGDAIRTTSLPGNVHTEHNVSRRKARAKALLKEIEQVRQQAALVDAVWVKGKEAYTAVVVNSQG